MNSKSFIHRVLEQLPSDNAYFSETKVLLPTKRACLYFRNELLEMHQGDAVWLPEIVSLKDFLFAESPLAIAPTEDLLALLYTTYLEVSGRTQSFSDFYKWGEMILKDFNDIDQYLVDTEYLFHYVSAYKRIDSDGILSKEQAAWLSQFWETVPSGSKTGAKREFLETWEHLGKLHTRFTEKLRAEGRAYEGMAHRALLEQLEDGGTRFSSRSFVIVGFNALSAFEERLFQHLQSNYETKLFWDADSRYLQDESQESGMFIRRYAKRFKGPGNHVIEHHPEDTSQAIEVVETDMAAEQCGFAIEKALEYQGEETAIVLCDESLIIPMIYRLPEQLSANITMGYPLNMSGLHSLIQKLCDFKFILETERRTSPLLLLKIFRYPWMEALAPPGAVKTLEKTIRQKGYADLNDLESLFPGESGILQALLSEGPTAAYLKEILGMLRLDEHPAEREVLKAYLKVLEEFDDWLRRYSLTPGPVEVFRLLRFRLSSGRIPFGPPEEGGAIQIMGFLETRNLDFRNVIIIGASDDHLPGTNKAGSFIPYTIRRGLGLPTHHENDAIYGYHFFRLLQRAERISLVYPGQLDGRKRSRSRFIEQIVYEWKGSRNSLITERSIAQNIPRSAPGAPITIDKSHPAIQERLQEYLDGSKSLSASAINTYVKCPVQFYLQKIAEIPEPEEVSDDLDQRDLGTVFHAVMEMLYKPFEGTSEAIDHEVLRSLTEEGHLKSIINAAFEENDIAIPSSGLKGRNLLVQRIIRELTALFIDMDHRRAPYSIEGLEWRFKDFEIPLSAGRVVKIKGTIDRIDKEIRGDRPLYTIIDYKTGKADVPKMAKYEVGDYFDLVFSDPKYKEVLQSYLYAWVYQCAHPEAHIKGGIYSARKMKDGLLYLHDGGVIPPQDLALFGEKLKALLEEMFDLSVPFTQKEEEAYQYSAYRVLID